MIQYKSCLISGLQLNSSYDNVFSTYRTTIDILGNNNFRENVFGKFKLSVTVLFKIMIIIVSKLIFVLLSFNEQNLIVIIMKTLRFYPN